MLFSIALMGQNPSPTTISTVDGKPRLIVDGRPFYVKGVGFGNGPADLLPKVGANTIRTWGTDQMSYALQVARKHNLKIKAGIWVQHVNHMDYNDPAKVEAQKQAILADIRKYKDNPEIIMWGIGNEMHFGARPEDTHVWKAVGDIVREAKKIDNSRPYMTVIADLGPNFIQMLNRYAPEVDIIGLNSYGGALSIGRRYKEAGGTRPVMMTEFGPIGPWETPKTPWGAAPEATSTEKAAIYRQVLDHMQEHQDIFMGSFAFLWGDKQEATATWFGMFLPGGGRLAAVDVMQEYWTGRPPADRAPVVESISIAKAEPRAGEAVEVRLRVRDPEGKPLRVRWSMKQEAERYGEGGFPEDRQPEFPGSILESSNDRALVAAPRSGAFRVFAYIYDPEGGAASANVVFFAR